MAELKPLEGTNYFLWFYLPQMWASLLFLALFIILTGLQIWKMVKTRTWFCIPFVIGGIFEFLGYALRAMAYKNTDKIMPYAFFSMATLLAPALFAASIYMTLGRLVRSVHAQSLLIISDRWITRIFVAGDIASFIVQGIGCGLMVMRNQKMIKLGEDIVVAGLAIQIIIFGFFGLTAALVHQRMCKFPTQFDAGDIKYHQGLGMLYAVSVLILIRSIFRLVEFVQGREGYLLQTEWPTLVFDGMLMFLTMVVFFIWHPAKYVSRKGEGSVTELGSITERPFVK
ncbi:unnamed protein product [Clonostachys rosea f. rosea IK726]|uniref:Uncharacterized protein n=2 Tax=Bionectria ochroleuca TaxID=29856 RepID=A0ACA9TGP5_BIOOC|nr:unnamed protein product [Clonostachys rosea f. rosea IK726]